MRHSAQNIIYFIVCCIISGKVSAQKFSSGNEDKATKARLVAPKIPQIKHEISFGYRLHTDGWSIYTDYGTVKSKNSKTSDMFNNVNVFQIEFSEKRSPRQEKLVVDENSSGNSGNYIYGKINNFYALKAGYGFRTMIAGKPDPGSVSIHWTNIIGASLGMLKPYYLNVLTSATPIRYTEDTKADFFDQHVILGSAGFGTGLNELQIIPGGHFKSLIHFDFSANRSSVVAIETGVAIDYYAEPVPIMFNQDTNSYFVSLFMAFQFGKRW